MNPTSALPKGFDDLKNQESQNMLSRDLQTPYLGIGANSQQKRETGNFSMADDEDLLTRQLLSEDPLSTDKK